MKKCKLGIRNGWQSGGLRAGNRRDSGLATGGTQGWQQGGLRAGNRGDSGLATGGTQDWQQGGLRAGNRGGLRTGSLIYKPYR